MTISTELLDALTKCQNPKCKKDLREFARVVWTPETNWEINFCSLGCCGEYIKEQQ